MTDAAPNSAHDTRPTPDVDADADPRDGRNETETQRYDRNWDEILQELRVTQTGTQILTGFLLALAFQTRFTTLDGYQIGLYLALVVIAAITTALGLAPVSLHRLLFRQRAKHEMVILGNRILRATLAAVGLLVVGVVMFVFDVVVSRGAGIVSGCIMFLIVFSMWMVVPLVARRFRNTRPRS